MLIGVPREIKRDEYRVAMLPVGVEELTRAGHQVLIESGAGIGSGITDAEYAAEGAEIEAEGGIARSPPPGALRAPPSPLRGRDS